MCVANSKALKIAGINLDSQVSGGVIDKDPSTKEPTGLLREKAQDLVLDKIPNYSIDEIKEGLRQCFRKLVEWGITTVHDAGMYGLRVSDAIQAYQELLIEKQLPVRVGLIIPQESFGKDLQSALSDVGVRSDFGGNWLKIVGMKYIADGSIGSHTAALREPYLKEPENRGVEVMSQEALNKRVALADAAGLRACIHAIGDRGIDMAIQAIELAQKNRAKPYLKHRIEHCGVCWPSQMKKIKELDIVVSSSTSFMFKMEEDSPWKEGLGAERMRRLYPHKELIEHGIVTAGNSDLGPAENAYPMIGIYTEVMRTCAPEQRISLVDAIRSYTIEGAKAGNDEAERGTIEMGKLADMVVLSNDPFSVPAENLLDIKVDFTIVDGKIMHERRDTAHV
jgi:predicted amidohydrolase YtcJ